jgi:hypothetical protein
MQNYDFYFDRSAKSITVRKAKCVAPVVENPVPIAKPVESNSDDSGNRYF